VKKVKRLLTEFKPRRYELYLAPDREAAAFSGRVVISGRKTGRPSQRLTFHQKNLKILSAKIKKIDKRGSTEIEIDRINTHRTLDELRLHTKEKIFPGKYEVEISFSGKITPPMHGIYPCNFKLKGQKKQLIATQFESHHAREAFPCIDEPAAKAVFGLTLTTPAGETVIANTPVKAHAAKGSDLITTFEDTPVMSTYLLAFAYGELENRHSKTKNGVDVRVYATPDKVKLTDFAVDTAVRCLEFFERYYGVPYPLPKLDLIGLPDFSSGAMENWGLITFRESVLYVDPKSSSIETKQYVAMVVCHEIAHMWFGNLVTMEWWNDLWLNESFANMMEYRAVDELYPEWDIWQSFVQREVGSALSRDALPNVQAVRTQVNHPDEIGPLFDPSIVYAKGGSLLNMVRHLVGEEDFRKGLKSYFEEYAYSNTQASDLWRHLKRASHIDIDSIMNTWLTKPGFPVVEVDLKPKNQFAASQRRLVIAAGPAAKSDIWQVPLAASAKIEPTILGSREGTFRIKDDGDYPLTLNHDGHSYFVAKYLDEAHFKAILSAVKAGVLSPTDRLLLLQNYLLLERAGEVTTLDNIRMLPAYAGEKEETVWGMMAGIIGNARNLIDKDKALETKLNAFVRPIAAPLAHELGLKGSNSDTAQTQKLRTLLLSMAAVAEDEQVIKEGLSLFNLFKQPSDLAPDIRSVVYFIAVRYGTKADFERLVKLYKSLNSADEKDEVVSELTASREPANIKQLLDMVTSEDVRLQDAPTWFAWLIRNRYATDAAWQWLHDNWDWVQGNYGDDKSYDRFPRYAAGAFSYPTQLEAYKKFFEPKSNVALERPIKLGIEEIEGRVAWRQRNEQPVKDWLKKS
jgi:aminopeptidase N